MLTRQLLSRHHQQQTIIRRNLAPSFYKKNNNNNNICNTNNNFLIQHSNNMIFSPKALAVATLVTLSKNKYIHNSPCVSQVSAFTPHPHYVISTTNYNHGVGGVFDKCNNSNNNRQQRMTLSSSVVPEVKEETLSTEEETTTNTNLLQHQPSTVIATAELRSFIPSPNGKSGVMAVKLLEENYDPTMEKIKEMNDDKTDNNTPLVEGDEALLSQTGMFGGKMGKKSTQSKATEGTSYVLCVKCGCVYRPPFNFSVQVVP